MIRITVLVIIGCLLKTLDTKRSPNELNISLEPPNPAYFWPITSAKHDVEPIASHSYAMLQGLNPPAVSALDGTNEVLNFIGNTGGKNIRVSYVQGYTTAINATCMLMNIFFTNIAQDAVLIQLLDSGGAVHFELRLVGTDLVGSWTDSLGNTGSGSIAKVPAGKWTTVGFNFNYYWDEQIDILVGSSKGFSAEPYPLLTPLTTLAGYSTIIYGESHDGTAGFQGEIGCLQIYRTSLLGGTLGDAPEQCDQTLMDPTFGDFTLGSVKETTTTFDSETTTASDSVTTTETVTQSSVNTEDATTTSLSGLTHSYLDFEKFHDSCNYLRIQGSDSTIAFPLETVTVTSLQQCVSVCNYDVRCTVISLRSIAGGVFECKTSDILNDVLQTGSTTFLIE